MTLKPLKEYNSSKFSGKLITPSFYLLSYSMILLNFAKSTHINLEFVEIYVYITLQVSLNLGQQSVLQKLWNILLLSLEILRVEFFFTFRWSLFNIYSEVWSECLGLLTDMFFYSVNLQYKADSIKVFFDARINSSKFTALKRYENLSQIKLYLATKQKLVFILFFPSFQSIFKFIFSNKQILCQ